MTISKYINTYLIGSGMINMTLFNYKMSNVDIIRNKKKTKLLICERIFYSFYAFSIGFIKLPSFINYIHIKLINDNPENYGYKIINNKEIEESSIFLYI